jgi:hypothetical protein
LGVEFYDVERASSIVAPGAGETDWLADFEEQIRARHSFYGEPEKNEEAVSPEDLV